MIDTVRPDRAAQILEKDKRKSPDNYVLDRMWRRYFIIFGCMTLLAIVLFAHDLITMNPELGRAVLCLVGILVLDCIGLYKFCRGRIIGPRRYLSKIEQFGKDKVLAQLIDESTRAYFFEEDNYENIMILTDDYLISVRDFIFAYDEIESLTFREHVRSDSDINRFSEEYTRTILRNLYTVRIVLKKGTVRREYIAIRRSEFGLFFKELKRKAPKIDVTYDRF